MSNLVKINNQNLEVKEFNGQRVVTFKDIDSLHERVEGTANKRFLDNLKHFEKGIDYFELTGEELREVKQLPNFGIGANASKTILITDFRAKEVNPYKGLSKELQAIFLIDRRTQEIEERVDNDLPECPAAEGATYKTKEEAIKAWNKRESEVEHDG